MAPGILYCRGGPGLLSLPGRALQGDKILVGSDKVPHPAAVRYCFHQYHKGGNIYNEAGIPLHPFRTDDWDAVTTAR